MYQKAIANPEIELWGDGTESRDFIFINDLVYAIDLILEKDSSTFNIYNLASGEEVTIETLAKLFFKELGGNIKYKFNGQTRAGDPRNWKASIEKLATLGFVPGHSLEDGLKTTALWLKTLN
jgi:UDP-glucose 4-epimerase